MEYIPIFGQSIGEILREELPRLKFIDMERGGSQLIEDLLQKVGEEFQNTNGPEFKNILNVAGLKLMDSEQKGIVLEVVRKGIIDGVTNVVRNIEGLDGEYKRAAVNALEHGMQEVS